MKHIIIIFILISGFCCKLYGTRQEADTLIINKKKYCLKSFPLEDLEFKNKPFDYGGYYFYKTSCWRGYIATWEIINDSLFLIEVVKDDITHDKIDLKSYFEMNDYKPIIKDSKIYANWYNAVLAVDNFNCIFIQYYKPKEKYNKLQFVNGVITYNKLTR